MKPSIINRLTQLWVLYYFVLSDTAEALFPAVFSLASLNGTVGFRIDGEKAGDNSGNTVSSVGDINGDGVSDLIIGAPGADSNGLANAGSSYVVYGSKNGMAHPLLLSSLNGTTGFHIDGEKAGDKSGNTVSSAGDINGDGVSDLIVGALGADPNGQNAAGSSYVVYGSKSGIAHPLLLSSLNGTVGFCIDGEKAGDFSGSSVSSVGDINGDGVSDLIVGALGADPNGQNDAGSSYVVYGSKSGIAHPLLLSSLNGTRGFRIDGEKAGDKSGYSVSSAGDINGDGVSDLLIGAPRADLNGQNDAGSSYVVYGSKSGIAHPLLLSSLNGTRGFRIDGEKAGDQSGYSVSSAGDINGDGVSDLIVGALGADPNGQNDAGSSYVVYGSKSGIVHPLLLSSLNGATGFRIDGEKAEDFSGYSVSSAGDINGDGMSDLLIGAPGSIFAVQGGPGSSYVVYGSKSGIAHPLLLSSLNGATGFRIDGEKTDDYSGFSVSSAGDVNDDGVGDLIIGAYYATPNGQNRAGSSYVIYGRRSNSSSTLTSTRTQEQAMTLSLVPRTFSSDTTTKMVTDSSASNAPSTATKMASGSNPSHASSPTIKTVTNLETSDIQSSVTKKLEDSSTSNTPILVGGIAGGVALVGCLGAIGVFAYRKKAHKRSENENKASSQMIPVSRAQPSDNVYNIVRKLTPAQPGHYQDFKELPQEGAHYLTGSAAAEVLGEVAQYAEAKHTKEAQSREQGYDDIPSFHTPTY